MVDTGRKKKGLLDGSGSYPIPMDPLGTEKASMKTRSYEARLVVERTGYWHLRVKRDRPEKNRVGTLHLSTPLAFLFLRWGKR